MQGLAAQGLQGLAAQGLHGLAAQGLQGLAAQGLQGLAAQGLHGLAAQGLHGFTSSDPVCDRLAALVVCVVHPVVVTSVAAPAIASVPVITAL
ncbi:hypothetical protein AB833_19935 [Chromatiales bacterium (ex Bugula neritina AB1)]|nr:hypothetical protein AB833_19935 [Chromatiales bacterium (ex Bugula neritina AB1)]